MFTLSSFFPTLPSEEAILRRRQNLARAEMEQFCRSMVQRLVDAIQPAPSNPVVRRRPGHPLGSFDVAFFCGRLVQNMVDVATKSSHSESTPAKPKKVYKSWSETERALTLDLAFEKGSDGSAVSMLRTIFPKAFGTTTGRGPVCRGGVPELQGVVQSVGGVYHNYRAWSSTQGGCTRNTGRGAVRRGGVPQLQGVVRSVWGVYHNYRPWSSP